ncbi:MAG: hypothetical protein IPQ08_06320 [Chitinophagaceae bacterium]|nr:hypothetical protein [Chitinophagaceae bacterium]
MNSKAILVFKLPEQEESLNHALNGFEYKMEIENFYEYLRNTCKYESFQMDDIMQNKSITERDKQVMYLVLEFIKEKFIQDCPKGLE